MIIKTTRFGEIEIEDNKIINMPMGLLGFSKLKKYIILDHEPKSPSKWFQSAEEASLAFVITDPFYFKPNYKLQFKITEVGSLQPKENDELAVSVIVSIPPDPSLMTANLRAPLLFNLRNKKGMQLVIIDSEYTTKHSIIDGLKEHYFSDKPKSCMILKVGT